MAAPVAARPGVLWDGRFRLLGPGLPHHRLGALGPPPAAVRRAGRHVPAGLLPTLPAIFCDGSLVVVPSLLYPAPEACAPFRLAFAPAGGPATGQGPSIQAYLQSNGGCGHSMIGSATLS